MSTRHEVHHLDQRVDGRAGGVLERVADGVADDGRGVRIEPLPPWWPSSMNFLALSHAPPAVRQEDGHQVHRCDGAGQEAGERADAETEADRDRAKSTASRPGVASSRSESRVQMSTTLPYSGLGGRPP
jgi:hypothetical protein